MPDRNASYGLVRVAEFRRGVFCANPRASALEAAGNFHFEAHSMLRKEWQGLEAAETKCTIITGGPFSMGGMLCRYGQYFLGQI